MSGMIKKKPWIWVVAAAVLVEALVIGIRTPAHGAEITGLDKLGDSITRTRSQGESWSFVSQTKASYTVELFGPMANGSGGGKGGSVSANIVLEEGQRLDVYLGPGAPAGSEKLDRATGASGSGYGDAGLYKAAVTSSGTSIMVAGGGGARGNPGNKPSDYSDTGIHCSTWGCTVGVNSIFGHRITYFGGTTGADGADGGGTTITYAPTGNGGSSSWYNSSGIHFGTVYTSGGGGGNGGASYASPLYSTSPQIMKGMNAGESKVIITMGGEIFPELDSKLIIEVKKEILAAISSMGAIGGTGREAVPEITVLKGKHFNRLLAAYPDMESGSFGSIEVENSDKGDKTIRISGIMNQEGYEEVSINGKSFLFHTVEEPDSSHVKVVFP